MPDRPPQSELLRNIARFETAYRDLKEATREANSVLGALQRERREVERLLGPTAKRMVDDRVAELVAKQLEELGPTMHKFSDHIYSRVGQQIDKLVDLCMGKEFSVRPGHEDLRPALAIKLREWMREILLDELGEPTVQVTVPMPGWIEKPKDKNDR